MNHPDTTRRFLRSAGAATLSQIWRVAVTFGTRLLLRRFVPDADWGLWDWALTVFLILGAVRDLGLVYHVVRDERPAYGNLLGLELVWGGLLAAAAIVGAPFLGLVTAADAPEKTLVLQALAVFLFFDGLASVPRVYFERELAVGRAVVPELVRNLFFAVTSVLLAVWGHGIGSLVAAYVGGSILYAAQLWWRARGSIPLAWQRGRSAELLRGSLPLACVFFLALLVKYVDPLVLAPQFPAPVVGNYMFAYETAFLASTILIPPIARALYPALVAYAPDPPKAFEAYRLGTVLILALEVPAALMLFANAEIAIRILGGVQWEGAPTFLRILCFAPLVDPVSRLGGELLKTVHQDRLWITSLGVTLVAFAGLGVVLTANFGATGMAFANFLPLGGLVMAYGLHRLSPTGFRALVRDLGWIYAVGIIPFLALTWIVSTDEALRFGLSLVALALVMAFYVWRFGADFRRFFGGLEAVGG